MLIRNETNPSKTPIFHHIPKCGGQSMIKLLSQWYGLIRDKESLNWETNESSMPNPVSLSEIPKNTCLIGHWDKEPIRLESRYPEVLQSKKKYFLFTFLRDPIEVKISLYYYLNRQKKQKREMTLKEHLLSNHNYLSGCLGVKRGNYKEFLKRYDFIGYVENYQASVNALARILGKPEQTLTRENTSKRDSDATISNEIKQLFKEKNELDYEVYDYCRSISS